MASKIFKVVWVFSLLGVLVVFMYVYASLPENVVVNENLEAVSMAKDTLFYVALALLAISNALVFVVTRVFPERAHDFKTWFYGLIMLANLFFIVALSFISLYNSGEKFDYPRLGVIIYGSILLMAGWIIAWPIYRMGKRFLGKQPI